MTPTNVPCPQCRKPADASENNPWRPFCSERCRLIDLGEWFDEEKRIPGPPARGSSEPTDDAG